MLNCKTSESRAQKGKAISHLIKNRLNSKVNRVAEASVKIAKRIMKKCRKSGDDPYLGLLNFRNTPIERDGSSPVQMLLT